MTPTKTTCTHQDAKYYIANTVNYIRST